MPGQEILIIVRGKAEGSATRQGRHEGVAGGDVVVFGFGQHGLDLGLRLDGRARGALTGPLDRGVGHERTEQSDCPDGIVVGRDDVVELVRVDIRVTRADGRDLELVGLRDGNPLAVRIHDEDRAGQALHLADAAEGGGELRELFGELRRFLLGEALELTGLLASLELLHQADALLDGHEVREHAAQPALVDVRHSGTSRLLGDRLLGLLLRPDEQDGIAAGDGLTHEVKRDLETLRGLGKIDDVNPVALRKNERAHLGIPPARLVAEMDSGFQQLAHRDGWHGA